MYCLFHSISSILQDEEVDKKQLNFFIKKDYVDLSNMLSE